MSMVEKTLPGTVLGEPGETSTRPMVKRSVSAASVVASYIAAARRGAAAEGALRGGGGGGEGVLAGGARRGAGMRLLAVDGDDVAPVALDRRHDADGGRSVLELR